MRILLVNQYAGAPSLGMEYRPHWMAVEWKRLGHDVLVVAGDRSHLRREQPPPGRSTIEGVDFLVLATPAYDGNGVRRFANILAFRAQLRRYARDLVDWRPDVVIASSTHPMDVRPGLRIARKAHALFVHEVHDLWPLTPKLLGGMSGHHPMIMWMQREEDLACSEADLVVSVLPATLPYLTSRGLRPDRWVFVSNGVPEDPVAGAPTPVPEHDGVFRVGYFGGHALSNDLGTLIEAARLLKTEPIELHLTGSGVMKAELQKQAHGLSHVHFHEEVPLSEARAKMRQMSALCLVSRATPLYAHGISPNKLYEYLAAGRPVVQAIDCPASPVALSGGGIECEGGNPIALTEAIRSLARRAPADRAAMGRAGQEYVRQEATYPVLARKFIDEITQRMRNARF